MRAIAMIDTAAHKVADQYYPWADMEPVTFGGVVIDSLEVKYTYGIPGLTLFDTVKMIATSVGDGEGAVIVGHGNDHALLLPLAWKTTQKLTRQAVVALDRYLSAVPRPAPEKAKAWPDIRIKSTKTFKELCEWLSIIREMNLGHIALRACNLGQNGVGFLDEIRKLFRCRMVSGPIIKDAYVNWNPNNVAPNIEHFESIIHDPRYARMTVWGTSPNRMAIQTTQTASQAANHEFSLESLAESPTAIQAFLQDQFPSTKVPQYRPGMTVPIHGLYHKGAIIFPNSEYYGKLMLTSPACAEFSLPMYIPPEAQFKPGLLARVRSRIQSRRFSGQN
jgi:hypothetical protein